MTSTGYRSRWWTDAFINQMIAKPTKVIWKSRKDSGELRSGASSSPRNDTWIQKSHISGHFIALLSSTFNCWHDTNQLLPSDRIFQRRGVDHRYHPVFKKKNQSVLSIRYWQENFKSKNFTINYRIVPSDCNEWALRVFKIHTARKNLRIQLF